MDTEGRGRIRKRWAFARRFFCLGLLAAIAQAAPPTSHYGSEAPARVLFVGNSFTYYNNGLHNHFRSLVSAAKLQFDAPRRVRIMTISGGHLPEHAGGLEQILHAQQWDVVVLQGHSQGPIGDSTAEPFRAAATQFSTQIRAAGAAPVFFMTWAYTGAPEMTAELDHAYTSIGQELGAAVVPVGLAFAAATRERPRLDLRIADTKHPTLAGTYLAACTFYATLYGRSPAGLSYLAGLPAADAEYLQALAWRTVSDYRRRATQ